MKAEVKIPRGWYRLRNGTKRRKGDRELCYMYYLISLRASGLTWVESDSIIGIVTKYVIVIRKRKGKR